MVGTLRLGTTGPVGMNRCGNGGHTATSPQHLLLHEPAPADLCNHMQVTSHGIPQMGYFTMVFTKVTSQRLLHISYFTLDASHGSLDMGYFRVNTSHELLHTGYFTWVISHSLLRTCYFSLVTSDVDLTP